MDEVRSKTDLLTDLDSGFVSAQWCRNLVQSRIGGYAFVNADNETHTNSQGGFSWVVDPPWDTPEVASDLVDLEVVIDETAAPVLRINVHVDGVYLIGLSTSVRSPTGVNCALGLWVSGGMGVVASQWYRTSTANLWKHMNLVGMAQISAGCYVTPIIDTDNYDVDLFGGQFWMRRIG